MNKRVKVQHFSDVLCVWAFIAQRRVDELKQQFGEKVELDYHFVSVFPHAHQKIAMNWEGRGGMRGYARHVQDVAEGFDFVNIHPDIWIRSSPRSSLPAHLFLSAVRLCDDKSIDAQGNTLFERAALEVRRAFFSRCEDISSATVLNAIAEELDLPRSLMDKMLENGEAFARLSEEFALAQSLGVRSSPTLIFNEGRQILSGNVGYRVIEANIQELLRAPAAQLSWC